MSDGDDKYWYNSKTQHVEHGMLSPAPERIGPFDTADEAERALEIVKERARAWAEEERREDSWGVDSAMDGFEG